MPNRSDFVAARTAAIDCANASGWLLQVAAGKAQFTPAHERGIAKVLDEQGGDDQPLEMPDPMPIFLPNAIGGLSGGSDPVPS